MTKINSITVITDCISLDVCTCIITMIMNICCTSLPVSNGGYKESSTYITVKIEWYIQTLTHLPVSSLLSSKINSIFV